MTAPEDFTRAAEEAYPEHGMLPGSHESGHPQCRCGALWDRWNDRCLANEQVQP